MPAQWRPPPPPPPPLLLLLLAALLAAAAPLFATATGCGDFCLTVEPSNVAVVGGSSVALQCSAPRAKALGWKYATVQPLDEVPLLDLQQDIYRSQFDNGSLELRSIGEGAPAGDYQCVASFDDVGTVVSRVATVSVPSLPGFEAEPRDLSVYPGEAAFFSCAVRGPFSLGPPLGPRMIAPEPKPLDLKVQWLKNEAPFRLDDTRMTLMPSGALEIDPVKLSDHGTYRCNVSLVGTPGYRLSNKAQLTINTDLTLVETVTAPAFIAEPRSQTAVEGSPVTMECAALGNPRPDIIWLNNGVAIDLNDLDSRYTLYGSGVLFINSVKENDAGTYQCRADNREDSLDATAILDVQVPPRFVKKPTDKDALEREDLELECEVYGRPEPTVRWLKNGEIITPNNHDMTFVKGYNLRIQGLMALDAGIFQCTAFNSAGNIQASARLTVVSAVEKYKNSTKKSKLAKNNKKTKIESSEDQYFSDNPSNEKQPKRRTSSFNVTDRSNRWRSFDNSQKPFDPKLILTSLVSSDQVPKFAGKRDMGENIPSSHDIFSSLISSTSFKSKPEDASDLDDDQESGKFGDFLGETSLAFTSTPIINPLNSSLNSRPDIGIDEGSEEVDEKLIPSEPLDFRAVIIKPRFVTLSWTEPKVTNGDTEVYAVIYKVAGSLRERVMNTTRGNIHEMNIPSLQPSTAYQFRVVAYNKNGPGPSTQVLDITTQSEDQSLGPPLDLTIMSLNPTSMSVSWQPPELIPGARVSVDKYQLFLTEMDTGRERSIITAELNKHLIDLIPFTEYGLRIVALAVGADLESSEGVGTPTEQIIVRTPGDAPSAPPLNVSLEAQTSTSVLVQWEAPPPEAQNGDITGFKIKYRKAGRKRADSLATPANARSVTLRDLERMATYQVRICAINVNGSGPYSEWYSVDTLRNDLDESRVPNEPSPLKTRSGSDYIIVSWAPPPKNQNIKVRGYNLSWGKGIPDVYFQRVDELTKQYTIKDLESNEEYVISLRANNQIGDGPPVYANVRTRDKSDPLNGDDLDVGVNGAGSRGPSVSSTPPLIPPVGLKADVLSGTTAVVYWTDTTLPTSQIVTDQRYYMVRYCAVGSQRYRYFNTTYRNCMIDELRSNTQYEFTVKVVKGNRESPWSMVVVNSTFEAAPSSHPRELRVTPAADGSPYSLTLQWLPPSKANGAITGYVILYTTDSSRRDREWIVQGVVGSVTSASVQSLLPATSYHFKIQARNAKGYGPFSPIVSFTTLTGNGMEKNPGIVRDVRYNYSLVMYIVLGVIGLLVLVGVIVTIIICCRRASLRPPTSPDTRSKSTYQKSSASNIKPPDLWIHHDQMELKQMDKSHHSSSGSGDGVTGMTGMTSMTLPRPPPPRDSCEYETAMPGGGSIHPQPPTGSLDKRHYVPTYVAMSSINQCGLGSSMNDTLGSSGMRSVYPRTQYTLGPGNRAHVTIDQNTPLLSAAGSSLSGTLPSQSSMSSLGQLGSTLPLHHHHSATASMGISPMSCSQISCGIGIGGSILQGPTASPSPSPASEGFPADAREREQGHYVAYEALHPPRDSIEGSGGTGSLGRGRGGPSHPLRSFSVPAPPPSEAPHTPHHHNKVSVTIRPTNTSPYKKPLVPVTTSSMPMSAAGAPINRLQQGLCVPHSVEEVEALAPSRSTERLHQEMANLEGLMKDLNAITASQFEC
ncbi:neogenin protein frazzled isoform X2 [Arctopsyche grandis]|uniref:neogenin protein frazzled isoform X2 n=1 Tax=Arctopsyche grandis TaxID=121162 RepID=UPI00406DA2E3